MIQGLEKEGNTLFDPEAPGTPANKITDRRHSRFLIRPREKSR